MKFVIVSATVLVSSLHFVIVSSDKTGGKVLVAKDRSDWSSTSFYNVASIDCELP
jgi:predicted carbohydrate-binding protein with CBM5 and CBM33 domain